MASRTFRVHGNQTKGIKMAKGRLSVRRMVSLRGAEKASGAENSRNSVLTQSNVSLAQRGGVRFRLFKQGKEEQTLKKK